VGKTDEFACVVRAGDVAVHKIKIEIKILKRCVGSVSISIVSAWGIDIWNANATPV